MSWTCRTNDRKTTGKPEENGGLLGFYGIYPLVNVYITMEYPHDIPIQNGFDTIWDLRSDIIHMITGGTQSSFQEFVIRIFP